MKEQIVLMALEIIEKDMGPKQQNAYIESKYNDLKDSGVCALIKKDFFTMVHSEVFDFLQILSL